MTEEYFMNQSIMNIHLYSKYDDDKYLKSAEHYILKIGKLNNLNSLEESFLYFENKLLEESNSDKN